MRAALLASTTALWPVAAWAAPAPNAACADILPSKVSAMEPRALLPDDLARLRDIGPADAGSGLSPLFTLSPDGRKAAFQLRRANPATNDYCLAMVIVDIAQERAPRVVDTGGELLIFKVDMRGLADFPTGVPLAITPRWSADGRWIAFLKRDGGRTQVWRAQADGSDSAPQTRSDDDVIDFTIGGDGKSLIYATRPGLDRARQEAEREALGGYHYDERFAPALSSRPLPPASIPRVVTVLDLATGAVRAASEEEAAALGPGILDAGKPPAGPAVKASETVWISAYALTGGAERGALRARIDSGREAICLAEQCAGAQSPYWTGDRRQIRFLRREGWASASTGIYEWSPATGSVRRLYRTDDVLASCVPKDEALICLREASLQPRRLERLDPVSGERRTLFDPNPEFRSLRLGRVERLRWRNAQGLEALGDLVFPVGYRRGERYPLIVVQYDTRGFLRGGTGDEYPIQAFANRGYAVLSTRRPLSIGLVRGGRTFDEINRLDMEGFADRRSALSAVEAGVRLAVSRGIADPARIGITGLSDGATQTISALLHSSLFSAAAMSSCCIDTMLMARSGPSGARFFHAAGYPLMTERNETFWKELSLSLNARRIKSPILLQLAEDEFLSALESYAALREVGAPIDMFVFPGEHHVKWQPAHRLAIYRRSIDWFDYWLRGLRSDAPDRQAELQHWDSLARQKDLSRPK